MALRWVVGGGRYLVREVLKDPKLAQDVHVFSTHFYTKLSEPLLINTTAPLQLQPTQNHDQGDASGEAPCLSSTNQPLGLSACLFVSDWKAWCVGWCGRWWRGRGRG